MTIAVSALESLGHLAKLALPATVARAAPELRVSAGTAFKIGFFGSIGALVATSVLWITLIIIFAACLGGISRLGR